MSRSLSEAIVEEARTWLGTRFQHQGRIKGLGVDCVGFISEVARNAGVLNVEIPNDYAPTEDGKIMLQLLHEHMQMVDEIQSGDVLALCDELVRVPDIPRHLVIVTEVLPHTTKIIHASQHGVREHRIDASWTKRIHSKWRLKTNNQRP